MKMKEIELRGRIFNRPILVKALALSSLGRFILRSANIPLMFGAISSFFISLSLDVNGPLEFVLTLAENNGIV